jgi:hypothetical protein
MSRKINTVLLEDESIILRSSGMKMVNAGKSSLQKRTLKSLVYIWKRKEENQVKSGLCLT